MTPEDYAEVARILDRDHPRRPIHRHVWDVLERRGHHEVLGCQGCDKVERVYVD
jgi:hypothetical protein